MKKIPMAARSRNAKLMYRWLLTAGILHTKNRAESGKCPICKRKRETKKHIYKCQATVVVKEDMD